MGPPLRHLGARRQGPRGTSPAPRYCVPRPRATRQPSRALDERFEGTIYRFVWRMLGSRATTASAEELLQDASLRMFRSLPRTPKCYELGKLGNAIEAEPGDG